MRVKFNTPAVKASVKAREERARSEKVQQIFAQNSLLQFRICEFKN